MADLLSFLQSPEAQLGIGLLAASGPTSRPVGFGERLAQGIGYAQQQQQSAEERALRAGLLRSQIAENNAQAKAKMSALDRQAARDQYYLGGAAPATEAGAVLKQTIGVPADAPRPSGGKFAEWSRLYNIPVDALMADYDTNGGKGLADMITKASQPNWVNVNGNLVNTNARGFQGGIQAGVAAGNDGRVTMWQPKADGSVVVGAPQGAFDTFAGFQDISNRSSAAYTPGRPVLGADGRTYGQSQGQEVGALPRPAIPGGYANQGNLPALAQGGSDPQAASREIAAIERDLRDKPLDPNSRAMLMAERERLAGQVQPSSASSPAGALDFSPQEKAAQEAARERAVSSARADVGRDTDSQKSSKDATKFLTVAEQASELLGKSPTASLAGAARDKIANAVGISTAPGDVAGSLEAVSGWLVANVPRMEGPQSNFDVDNYRTMAGRIGDRTLPISTRKAALNSVIELQNKYSELNGGKPAEKPKTFADRGYNSANAALQDARNAIMRGADRSKVEARLREMGLSLQ